MLKVRFSKKFRKDLEKARKRGLKTERLDKVVLMLSRGESLPIRYRDHALESSRDYKGLRECHIQPDWLLIYRVDDEELVLFLIRTGTHSDLF